MDVRVEQVLSLHLHIRVIEFLLVLVSVIESLLLTTVSDCNVIKYVRELTTFSCNLYTFVSSI